MPRKKKIQDPVVNPEEKPDELSSRRQEFDRLRSEARSYGVVLMTQRLGEARKIVENLRLDRVGKPPCYKRSFLESDPRCRVCELRFMCTDTGQVKEVVPREQLETVQCQTCNLGQLNVEILHPITHKPIDYGCTTPGCAGSVLGQTQWAPPAVPTKAERPKDDVIKVVPKRKTLVDLEDEILAALKGMKNATPRAKIMEITGETQDRVSMALQELIDEQLVVLKKGRGTGYCLIDKKK